MSACQPPTVTTSYAQHIFHARRPVATPRPVAFAPAAMPRPNPPPTPGSSSDLRGKEGCHAGPGLHLPPTAYQEQVDRAHTSSATPSVNGSESSHSSYRPASPTSPVEAPRKRPAPSSGPVITKDDFALPPPPTRSRKIIQMKPRNSEQQQPTQSGSTSKVPATGDNASTPKAGSKRKSASGGTTAAGRKIARKTAHSLIERRRRSKMNEEFGVLKDMVPACQGQEMHKLAILQVGRTGESRLLITAQLTRTRRASSTSDI